MLRWYDELVRYGQSREATVIEADVDVCDLPEGELVFTNVGPTS